MKSILPILACAVLPVLSHAHEMSEEVAEMLHAPVPDWMFVAAPIKVQPSKGDVEALDEDAFRDPSGGATNSRNKVYIPEKDFVHEFNYKLNWSGGSSESKGVSLSPDGTKLLTSSGSEPYFRLYEFRNEQLEEVEISLPRVTYDDGPKGFIYSWSWLSDDVLVGYAEVLDDESHTLMESRIYTFQLGQNSLARLDYRPLQLEHQGADPIEVLAVGTDLSQLVLQHKGVKFLVKADLKSPHQILANRSPAKQNSTAARRGMVNNQQDKAEANPPADGASSAVVTYDNLWLAVPAVCLLGGIALLLWRSNAK